MTEGEFKSFADANPLRRGFLLKIGPDGFSKLDYDIATDRCNASMQTSLRVPFSVARATL
jgi:hypothetical protein